MSDSTSTLQAALRSAVVTREVVIARGAVRALPDLVLRTLPASTWLIVADETTWRIAGQTAYHHLAAHGVSTRPPLVLPAQPRLKPHAAAALQIAERIREGDAVPVAIGSGVVNDLVKYAAALAGKPYVCLATAASMDGYAASGAALLEDGFKRTLPCGPPLAVLADLDVLGEAPAAMNAWGYGDLAGKTVAGADWLLADALGIEAIDPRPFSLVQDHLAQWLTAPERLAAREPEALGTLLAGLLVSGFAMQAHGNSRPASGSDHQFSHLWEMENLQVDGVAAAHGACVGIGCVAMLALYEWLLAQPQQDIVRAVQSAEAHDDQALAREIDVAFDREELKHAARAEMKAKRELGSRCRRAEAFARVWPDLRARVAERLMGAGEMQRRLRAVGGVSHPMELGIDAVRMAADYRRARLIRRRYTLLDLLEDLGWLERATADLYALQGFWGRQIPTLPDHTPPRRQP